MNAILKPNFPQMSPLNYAVKCPHCNGDGFEARFDFETGRDDEWACYLCQGTTTITLIARQNYIQEQRRTEPVQFTGIPFAQEEWKAIEDYVCPF
jgi:hypothetical protein